MAIKDNDFLAAVSGALDNGADTPTEVTETTDEPEIETPDPSAEPSSDVVDDPAGAGGEGADGEAGEVELDDEGKPVVKAGEEGEPAADVPKGADGKPLVGAALAAHNAKKAGAAKEGAAPVVVKKDPINDPIPKELKKETQERMVALVNVAKELTAKVTRIETQHNDLMGMIQETKSTPEQYGQALDYLRLVNSGDPANIEKCIKFMQGELVALCRMVGKSVPGVDLLAEHADLTEAVANGAMSQEHAEELSNARAQRAHETAAVRQSQTTQQQAAEAHRQGIADLNALEAELATNDAQYKLKRPLILEKLRAIDPVTKKSLIQSTPPNKWEALFLKHYGLVKLPAPRAATPAAPGAAAPKNQPLRAGNPAGGQQKAPASLAEAIDFGIAAGSKR